MPEPSPSKPALSLDQLVALNDELIALVRAGIPLERGLVAAAGDYRGALRAALRDLGTRLEAGEPLPEAMARSNRAIPEINQAIITAGLRSGRLADALEGLTRIGLAVADARRTIVLACLYPLLVVVLAYALALLFLVEIFPRFAAAAVTFRLDDFQFNHLMTRAGESVFYWGPVPPLLLLGLIVAWVHSGRSQTLDSAAGLGWLVGRLPMIRRIVANYRTANFIDLLGHLVEHNVPLDQAVRLAGDASGDPAFRQLTREFATGVQSGTIASGRSEPSMGSFPPLVAWMLSVGDRQGSLVQGLRHLALVYRRRADRYAATLQIILPGLLILLVGSIAVLGYGMLLFLPVRQLWDGLGDPLNNR